MAQTVKRLPAMRETRVWFLGWEDPLEKEMAIHSSTLAWKIPWTEEPGRLQSQRVGHDWATSLSLSGTKTISMRWGADALIILNSDPLTSYNSCVANISGLQQRLEPQWHSAAPQEGQGKAPGERILVELEIFFFWKLSSLAFLFSFVKWNDFQEENHSTKMAIQLQNF